jgi:ATP-binding protein involved in chromosome partitioning
MAEAEKPVELLKINVEQGWNCDLNCMDCYRFFECPSDHKYHIYNLGRLVKVKERLSGIKHKIGILSGKGGVGKSTVTANLAAALAGKGFSTGVVDSDFYGPSIPRILGIKDKRLRIAAKGIIPASSPLGVKVISTAFFVDKQESVTWFHDLKRSSLEQFLADVDFGNLDYLLIDLPPGTGPETINVMKLIPEQDGVVVVTIPSEVSLGVARRAISLCHQAKIPVIGVVENMSGFVCTHCGQVTDIFTTGGGERLSREMEVPFLGRVPLDRRICEDSDNGIPFIVKDAKSAAAKSFMTIVERVEEAVRKSGR